jgi:hypothetical protein
MAMGAWLSVPVRGIFSQVPLSPNDYVRRRIKFGEHKTYKAEIASGHMVYAHEPDPKALHDNVASFIGKAHQ